MSCRFAQSHLSAYLDAELTGMQQQMIRHHLLECSECEQEYEKTRRIKQVVNHLPVHAPPAGMEQRLHEKIAQLRANRLSETRRFSIPASLWGRVGWAVAIGLLLLWLAPREPAPSQGIRLSTNLSPGIESLLRHDSQNRVSDLFYSSSDPFERVDFRQMPMPITPVNMPLDWR